MATQRRSLRSSAKAVLIFVALSAASRPAPCADPPEVALFVTFPKVLRASLSPSGEFLAVATHLKGERFKVAVVSTADPSKGMVVARSDVTDVADVSWVNDRRLIVSSVDLSGESGVAALQRSVFAVDRDGAELIPLITGDWNFHQDTTGSSIRSHLLPPKFHVLRIPDDGSDDIIVGEFDFDRDDGHMRSVMPYRLNTRTRQLTPLVPGKLPEPPMAWVFDGDNQPRVYVAWDKGRRRIYYREAEAGNWRLLGDFDAATDLGFAPRFFGYDGTLYVTESRGGGTSALYRYDLKQNRAEDKPLVRIDGFDFDGSPELDPKARKILGFHFHADAYGTAWTDVHFKELQARIDKALPATVNRISCGECLTSKVVMVTAASDRQPNQYYLFNPASGDLVKFGEARPDLNPAQMAERNFFRFPARDGLSIPMYVTLPPGKPAGPLPTIVFVHGGPWVRGASWEWSNEAQFLATRGYAVLEPEFRGSTGYGFKLFEAGWRQWGLAMQDDLADAAKWAIDKGIADPKRIGIGGASYGGYATLMGLIKNPELFRCGFEWVGVTDIGLMYSLARSDMSEEARGYELPRLVGDRYADADQLRETSPLANASRLKQPLLMAYGKLDHRVPREHGIRFRDAVSETNKNVEWIEYPEEGHGWYKDEDNIDFWTRVDRFLKTHLAEAR